jgi:argininosuccinate lyase
MTNELFATETAYRLVKQGIPFKDAYLTVAKELFDNH